MLPQRLKILREERGLLQSDIAKLLNITPSAYGYYEQGKREPKQDALLLLANLYEVSTDYLLGKTNSRKATLKPKGQFISTTKENNIRYWINKSLMGDDEIAKELGISEELLEDYCSGYEYPSLESLQKLSKICNVSTDCLLGLRETSRCPDPDGELPFRFDPEISRRLKEQMQRVGESYSQIAATIGIEEEEVFDFLEYGFVPHISVFAQIVEHFLVSSDFLLNKTGSTLTVQEDEEELLRSYRALNSKSKTMALSRIYELEREESLVAAKNRFLDSEGKSLPSSGTGGDTIVS